MLLNAILTWFHILGAIGWLGAAMFLGMLIGPLLPKLSPGTRSELILKLFPRLVRYVQGFSIFTLVFGVALAYVMVNGDLSILAPTNSFGLYITSGAILALVAVGVVLGLVLPSARKVLKITKSLVENPGPPPGELLKASNRMKRGTPIVMVLLILVLIFMVAAANP